MTTAAKRARKKANKLKGWPGVLEAMKEMTEPEVMKLTAAEAKQVEEALEEPVTTESEHAAAMTALAQVKRMRKKAGE